MSLAYNVIMFIGYAVLFILGIKLAIDGLNNLKKTRERKRARPSRASSF